MPTTTAPHPLRGPLPILAASVLWGTTGTTSSFAPTGIPRAAIGAAGLLLGGLLLAATARGTRALLTSHHRPALTIGTLAVAGYPLTFYPAVADTGVAVATVVALGSAPVFTGLLTWLTTGLRPTTRWSTATTVAILGCALLVLGEHPTSHTTDHTATNPLGIALAALAGLSYATYTTVSGHLITTGHPARAVMGTLFGGAAILITPVVILAGGTALLTPRAALVIAHLAVVTTFLAYLLFGHGLRHTTATTATTLTLTEPAVAALLGITVLGERLSPLSWSGLAVLGAATITLSLPHR
ncbi:MAG TPA: EamA family transporter [Sporichthyaceae bacterium]|nr:EamA family transporter [Sporichthyaceae bacterium]